MTPSALDQLKTQTIIVADSSDLNAIQKFRPRDATTNPSLITASASQPENLHLIETAYQQAKSEGYTANPLIERTIDLLTVQFGIEILKLIDGRISTEVDAALSYDTAATVAKAKELISIYQAHGIDQKRILIKIASTWEGIQAAKQLEAENIHCNLTLLFGMPQAQACADAKVTLISPFVGRILDWHKKAENVESYPIDQDPGVRSVKQIYDFYKQHRIKTEIMGASFRSIDQVLALAGCDLLTVAPSLLAEMQQDYRTVKAQLSLTALSQAQPDQVEPLNEETFKIRLQNDLMTTELLQSGIDGFIKAREQLKMLLCQCYGIDAEIKA